MNSEILTQDSANSRHHKSKSREEANEEADCQENHDVLREKHEVRQTNYDPRGQLREEREERER